MVKGLLHAVAAWSCLLVLVACGASGNSTAQKDTSPVNLGVVILSAAAKPNEDAMMQGMKLAVKQLNAKGGVLGGRQLQLDFCEDELKPDLSTSCTNKLLAKNYKVIILDTASGLAMADQRLTGDAKVVAILPSQQDDALTQQGNRYLFRVGLSGAALAKSLVPQIVNTIKPTKVALFVKQDPSGPNFVENFTREFKNTNASIVYSGSFSTSQTDFSSDLAKIEASGAEVVVPLGETAQGIIMARQIKQFGYKFKFIASGGMTSDALIQQTQGAMENQYAVATSPPVGGPDFPEWDPFLKAFQTEYSGARPAQVAIEAYSSVLAVAKGLNAAGTISDAAKIRDAMSKVNFMGPTNTIQFDSTGNNSHASVFLLKVQNGQYVLAK